MFSLKESMYYWKSKRKLKSFHKSVTTTSIKTIITFHCLHGGKYADHIDLIKHNRNANKSWSISLTDYQNGEIIDFDFFIKDEKERNIQMLANKKYHYFLSRLVGV